MMNGAPGGENQIELTHGHRNLIVMVEDPEGIVFAGIGILRLRLKCRLVPIGEEFIQLEDLSEFVSAITQDESDDGELAVTPTKHQGHQTQAEQH